MLVALPWSSRGYIPKSIVNGSPSGCAKNIGLRAKPIVAPMMAQGHCLSTHKASTPGATDQLVSAERTKRSAGTNYFFRYCSLVNQN
jgi:hypothetical protein